METMQQIGFARALPALMIEPVVASLRKLDLHAIISSTGLEAHLRTRRYTIDKIMCSILVYSS